MPLGGTFELFSLFELEYPIVKDAGIKFVTFFDAGNNFDTFPGTSNRFGNIEPFTIRMDAGFGIRWFSPIGPLRFEFGYPLNPKPSDSPSVFQFFIGPPF